MINKMKKYVHENTDACVLLFCSMVFFLFWFFFDGVILCSDSNSYIRMDLSREPVYPSILAIGRFLFGEMGSLRMTVFLQSILAAYAAFRLTIYLKRYFCLSMTISFLLLFVHFGVSLLNRFAAARGSIYFNSIMTEGMGISIWVLFFTCILKIVLEKEKKAVFLAFFYCVLLTCLRKQLLVSLLVLAVVLFLVYSFPKINWKAVGGILVGMTAVLVSVVVIGKCYNYLVRGELVTQTRSSMVVTTAILYSTDETMESAFVDERAAELFREISKDMEEQKCTYAYAGNTWYEKAEHFGESFDTIGFDVLEPKVTAYLERQGYTGGLEEDLEYDRVMNELTGTLLPVCLPTMTKVFLANYAMGLVNTVAKLHRILNWYAWFVYLAYMMLAGFLWKKGKREVVKMAAAVLLSIILNTAVTAAVIFCQTRYMIYNMTLFYIAGIVMLVEGYRILWKKRG